MNARPRYELLATVLLATSLLAPGSEGQTRKGYTPTDVASGGTIVGVVRFDGAAPAPQRLDPTTKEDVCHRDPIHSEKLVVSGDSGVRWAVVSIKGIGEGKPFPVYSPDDEKRPTLDQTGCVFDPHVTVVPKGQVLRVLNNDGVLHNVHTWPKKNRSKNIAMPGAIKETKLKFRRNERIRVTCDVHSWMEAWIVVAEHPYYVVSDEKGEFKLTDVPPGTYTLHLWHETLGEVEQQITVKPNADTRAEFTLRDGT
jgi:plastocyanin